MNQPAHSALGASGMHRWANCPGSVTLCEGIPPQPASESALRGTALHEIAALCLTKGNNPDEFIDTYWEVEGVNVHIELEDIEIVKEYIRTVRVDFIFSAFANEPATLIVEERFSLPRFDARMFGTVDAAIIEPKALRVYDLKTGHHEVEAAGNLQLLYYALSIIHNRYRDVPPHIELIIVQPKAGGVKRAVISYAEYSEFQLTLAKAVNAVNTQKDKLVAGDWCHFCPAKPHCPAIQAAVNHAATVDFTTLANEQLGEQLAFIKDVVEPYCKAINEHAQRLAERGTHIPGWKLVEKRATRKWSDANAAISRLAECGVPEDKYLAVDVKGPAAIEKAIGKKNFAALPITDLIVKESSGTTLAPESDPRPAYTETLLKPLED